MKGTNFKTSRFSTPQPNMDVSFYDIAIKSPQMHTKWVKSV